MAALAVDTMLIAGIHHRWRAGAETLYRDRAAALRADVRGHAAQQVFEALDHAGVVVANLEQHFRASRDDTGRAGI
jgi:hypothetical protein